MSKRSIHDFGVVDEKGDFYEFRWVDDAFGECRLDGVIQTERGPRRTELAVLSAHVWTLVSERTIRELAAGMGETEQTKKPPTLKVGINRLSPLIGRELAVLLWALMESDSESNIEAILHGWRELAREERWWLYAKGAAPGQRTGAGWRLALFHALSEMTESSSPESVAYEKKKPGSGYRSSKKSVQKKRSESRKNCNETNPEKKTSNNRNLPKLIPPTTTQSKKHPASSPTSDLTKSEKKGQPEKKVKKPGRTATTNN
jgi:hypothetical protein